jgi:hypothetical protein
VFQIRSPAPPLQVLVAAAADWMRAMAAPSDAIIRIEGRFFFMVRLVLVAVAAWRVAR